MKKRQKDGGLGGEEGRKKERQEGGEGEGEGGGGGGEEGGRGSKKDIEEVEIKAKRRE